MRQPTRYQPALWAAVRTATLGFLMLTNHAFAFEVKVGTVIYPGEDRHPLKFSKANLGKSIVQLFGEVDSVHVDYPTVIQPSKDADEEIITQITDRINHSEVIGDLHHWALAGWTSGTISFKNGKTREAIFFLNGTVIGNHLFARPMP